MRRYTRASTHSNKLIFRATGCLLLALMPLVIVLACVLVWQVADLMAGAPLATPEKRLVRRPVPPAGNPAGVQVVPVAAVFEQPNEAGGLPDSRAPVRRQRMRPTPTPAFMSRLITTAKGVFGQATPTPFLRSFTPIPTYTPTPPPTTTPSFTPSPPPSAISTLPPSPTALPPTATSTPLAPQVSSATTVNVRTGPGTIYSIAGSLQPGTLLPVTGRNQDSSWWQVQLADGQSGWVAAWVVEARDAVDVPVVAAPPVSQPAVTSDSPAPAETPTLTPVPVPEYDFILAEFYNSPTTNSFLTVYVAIVDPNEIPIGGIKIVGTRLDHNLTYDSPLSTWHFEGYSAPGTVIKSGNVKFEPPGGIESTSWSLHLEDAQGNRLSEDVPFDTDVNDKQWYFIKFRRKY